MWFWPNGCHPQKYTTSANGLNFSPPTNSVIVGATHQGYDDTPPPTLCGWPSVFRTVGGVYLCAHGSVNSLRSLGIATSGDGETLWFDIDTGGPEGDPIFAPGTDGVSTV
jgi:hypothetical protein